ncbi:hypothetical protein C8F04DRAFT_114915 [Mycena alexandri]|uniref:Polysaccharide lyase 14 domain-containing protein n=1 Tax=Mycena alexandri TaxID=1745969 RepID=A0AAD6TDN7_9AGAR|nr:hypothetical protein C8F04DRAFT_114915 [Mycena alexandri]
MVLLSALALSLLCGLVLSFPVSDDNSTVVSPISVARRDLPVTQALTLVLDAVGTLLVAPAQIITPTTAVDSSPFSLFPVDHPPPAIDTSQSAPSVSFVLITATEIVTDTEILIEPPMTITVSATPSTVTQVVTDFIPTPAPRSSTSSTSRLTSTKAEWAAPTQMTDLSAFNVTAFPAGQQNLQLVNGIPASATPSSEPDPLGFRPSATATPSSYIAWNNDSTVMQLLYPAGSSNPAGKPQGGAEIYCTPLDITSAQMVTLVYSVFFPNKFNWVKGGKLPGLYGGRTGCSGGDAALNCFSTRLMWRQGGKGELYLYAKKDKQTDDLCNDPQSECNADYGFSIGRGSFKFVMGGWTTVSQTVRLNTPGEQDGGFLLLVNGQPVIHREDIFYRDIPPPDAKMPPASSTSTASDPDDDDDGGGLLSPLAPLITGLTGLFNRRTMVPGDAGPFLLTAPTAAPQSAAADDVMLPGHAQEWVLELPPPRTDLVATETMTTTSTVLTTVMLYPTLVPGSEQSVQVTWPIRFQGIFFSTFFGGHGSEYATPKDQNVWFKDFDLVLNR